MLYFLNPTILYFDFLSKANCQDFLPTGKPIGSKIGNIFGTNGFTRWSTKLSTS